MAIIISKRGKNATKVERTSFEREDYLQKYIYDNPESIPLYDIKEDIRLLILVREFPTRSGPIDALGTDKDGEIYLIETKLYKNPDKRTVVAQVLDYGAAFWHSHRDSAEFVGFVEAELQRRLGIGLNQRLKDFFGLEEDEVTSLLGNLRDNLAQGNFKFVVLMDKLHEQLKDLVIFLNQNSRFDLFAVEIEYYKYEDYEIIIPKLFGAEVVKPPGIPGASGPRGKWDEKTFFQDAAERLGEEELAAVKKLYEFSKRVAEKTTWGTGAKDGSFNAKFDKISVRSLYTVSSNGLLKLNFGWLDDSESTERYRDEFKRQVERIKGLAIPEDYRETWVRFLAEKWCPVVDDFILAVQNLLKKETV